MPRAIRRIGVCMASILVGLETLQRYAAELMRAHITAQAVDPLAATIDAPTHACAPPWPERY
ncbi:hypothetical protein MMON_47910 [Mycolicibacterium monacense]|uniref:Uncharacterized protein n=1 Tax=Mycolicibacterium monacense TaxID=85693 RepID=A0AAD1N209_MYCMB|nr:hypothetical protein MMON_47910 [Mycolicibacterium monacense]